MASGKFSSDAVARLAGEVGTVYADSVALATFGSTAPRFVGLTNLEPTREVYVVEDPVYIAVDEIATVQPLIEGGSLVGLKNRWVYKVAEDHLTVLQLLAGDDDQTFENDN